MADSPRPLLEDWPAPEPAPGFADRVLARLDAEGRTLPAPAGAARGHRARAWRAAAAGALVAALCTAALFWALRPRAPGGAAAEVRGASGSHPASSTRQTLRLGARGVAVAEAEATLSWQVGKGQGQVSQPSGSVFYRVEHAAEHPFVVVTPHGQIRVTGTCFTVDVSAGQTRVRVHEGSVVLDGGGASAQLGAGDRATVDAHRLTRGEVVAPVPAPAGPSIAAERPALPTTETGEPRKLEPDQETLVQWAKRCRVVSDMPPFDIDKMKTDADWESYARSLGATAAETAMIRDAFTEVEAKAVDTVNQIGEQVVGEPSVGSIEDLDRIVFEIFRAAEFAEQFEIVQRLSAERAGLAPRLAHEPRSPLEALMRGLVAQGELFEQALARRLGPARARALRARNEGWPGPGVEWEGCPKAAR
ncbi:MAG: FecR domain-containing protein [Myxococcales bacterium]|nr:FecR domain-containing protein [Myxococcales bacterium]